MAPEHPAQRNSAVPAFAARQHGLVTVAQLRAAGMSPSAISRHVASGRLHRIHRGVYAVGHPALSREGRWLAAVLAAGPGAALSHLAAAALWGVWRRAVPRIDVVASRPWRVRGVSTHRARALHSRDVTVRHRIPVTTIARLVVDLTDVLPTDELATVIHEAEFHGCFSEAAARDAMARASGRRQLARLEEALAARSAGSAGTRSSLERRFRALLAGLPQPLANVDVVGIEVDFHWPAHGLCVEVDGPGHRRPRTRRSDAARDRVLRASGFRVLRFSHDDLDARPAWIADALRQVLSPRCSVPTRRS